MPDLSPSSSEQNVVATGTYDRIETDKNLALHLAQKGGRNGNNIDSNGLKTNEYGESTKTHKQLRKVVSKHSVERRGWDSNPPSPYLYAKQGFMV